ncbi:ribosome maturation factor RimM [Neorickettsia sp. 179522]|uniref:ribosome maturation factor RimM n=1 Tax=Neorickettsia sp. 179522 TaxID=1714371 RepID=UPI001E5892B8|nr:ribosome maturation factor RimM [Neorickettsia sp. 179522]
MVCAGRVTSTHGVRGCVRFRSYMSANFKFPGIDLSIGGISYTVCGAFSQRFPMLVLTLSRIGSACEAEKLVGLDVFLSKSLLPTLQVGEYYCGDLVGLAVYASEEHVGYVSMLYDFGAAAEVLEIVLLSGKKVMIPFTSACVADIDLNKERVEVVFPQEI